MLTALRKRVTYTNVAMTLALVFAMTGGAYAAKKFLITSTKQISPSVLKSLQGKAGPAGVRGAAGPAGAQGVAGAAGKDGINGEKGESGTNGVAGESVATKVVKTTEAACSKLGGSEFKVGSGAPVYACNGKEGSPWTAGGSLPSGKTETGTWDVAGKEIGGTETSMVPISFTIPLASELEESKTHFYSVGETPTQGSGCFGGTAKIPTAEKGNLCVYAGGFASSSKPEILFSLIYNGLGETFGASKAGAALVLFTSSSTGFVTGTWAVTAP